MIFFIILEEPEEVNEQRADPPGFSEFHTHHSYRPVDDQTARIRNEPVQRIRSRIRWRKCSDMNGKIDFDKTIMIH